MICRVLLLFAILCTSVCSLPVTSSRLESEDVKVLKCIVEALADVLSKPRPLPVSQDCLLTLTTDERLVQILRHQNLLKELQEIAHEGNQKRESSPLPQTQTSGDSSPDGSMLRSVGGPGERSILSQERRSEGGERREERGREEIQDGPEEEDETRRRREEEQKRGDEENKGSTTIETTLNREEEKREKEEKKEKEEKRGGGEERESSLHSVKPEEREEEEKRGEKRGGEEKRSGLKLWSKRNKEEIPHHSKEMPNQEVSAERRSPEEEELQLMAHTEKEKKKKKREKEEEVKKEEEEGSGNKKDSEMESLATIESQLERVAERLHELSRGDRGQRRV